MKFAQGWERLTFYFLFAIDDHISVIEKMALPSVFRHKMFTFFRFHFRFVI